MMLATGRDMVWEVWPDCKQQSDHVNTAVHVCLAALAKAEV